MALRECKSCGMLIFPFDDLSYGCPNCESPLIGEYRGIIGQYARARGDIMKEKKYTIFDLFAGCGGLSQGFLDIKKFKIPIANEYWKPAQLSYKSSHPETKLFEESIIDLTNSKIDNELKNKINYKCCGFTST